MNPVNIKLLNNMGRLEEKRANFDAAVKYYNKALALEDKSLRSYLNLGNLYSRLSKFDEAEAVYRKVSENVYQGEREGAKEKVCPDITSLANGIKWKNPAAIGSTHFHPIKVMLSSLPFL